MVYEIYWTLVLVKKLQDVEVWGGKSRIWETVNLSTDVDSITIAMKREKIPYTGDTNSLDRCGKYDQYIFEEVA